MRGHFLSCNKEPYSLMHKVRAADAMTMVRWAVATAPLHPRAHTSLLLNVILYVN